MQKTRLIVFSLKQGDEEMNLIPDWLSEGFSSTVSGTWSFLSKPIFKSEPAPRFSFNLTKAQQETAVKVGVVAVGIASLAAGVALVARAWNGNWAFRKEIQAVLAPSLLPQASGAKESVFNPVHLVGRIKSLFSDKMLPFVAGIVGVTAGAFVFSRFDQVLKVLKK